MARAATLVLVGIAAVPWWLACHEAAPIADCAPAKPEQTSFSLLAVGDTGRPSHFPSEFNKQLMVGRALEEEDRRSPSDALVFLGDNFYHAGLRAEEAEVRIRENLVRPYCAFVELDGPLSPRTRSACPGAHSRGIPILAVLGNHDYGAPESPGLERDLIPQYVSNWRVPDGLATVVEIAPGVSLIFLDSERINRGEDPSPVTRALRDSLGPWRILVSHEPVFDYPDAVRTPLLAAIASADVPVHVSLAGHEHNLQAWIDNGLIGLQVVSGAGSSIRAVENEDHDFALPSLGFVRVDRVTRPDGERLEVSVISVPRWPWQTADPWPAARFLIDRKATAEPDASCMRKEGFT